MLSAMVRASGRSQQRWTREKPGDALDISKFPIPTAALARASAGAAATSRSTTQKNYR
jgi:hypothetical protein